MTATTDLPLELDDIQSGALHERPSPYVGTYLLLGIADRCVGASVTFGCACELIPSDNPPVGVGQTSVPLVAPAIGNAVAQLTDIRLRQLPMSPERVKTALG